MLLPLALVAQIAAAAPGTPCDAPTAPALDHAVIAVRDLGRASDAFRRAGFRIKAGRLHANGLLNRHVKFPDGTELELMTVQGAAGDDMARDYADLLYAGEGGAYLALKARDLASVERHAAALRLEARRSSSGPWRFLSFGAATPAAAVFFTAGGTPAADADSIFRHEPRVTALAEIWLEGGAALGELLRRLGSRPCGEATGPDGRTGERWALSRGSVVLVPARGHARPRVLGAVLVTSGGNPGTIRPLSHFWIRYRRSGEGMTGKASPVSTATEPTHRSRRRRGVPSTDPSGSVRGGAR